MTEAQRKQVQRLQSNLSTIRKIAGWHREDMAELIGVSRPTIYNLESKKTEMTLTQYIAIRSILDLKRSEDDVLDKAVMFYLDMKQDKLTSEQVNALRTFFEEYASHKSSRADDKAGLGLAAVSLGMLTAFGALLTIPIIAGTWLNAILSMSDTPKDSRKGPSGKRRHTKNTNGD